MEPKKKEQKKKAKYSMARCIKYMLSLAWKHMKSVIGVAVLLATVSVVLNLVQLYVAPEILERVEQQASMGELLGTITVFSAAIFFLMTARSYINNNTLLGRIYVRMQIIKSIARKSCKTSYPNQHDPKIRELMEGASAATNSNDKATESIWTTLTDILTNVLGFIIYLALLSELNLILAAIVVATTVVGFFVRKHIRGWGWRHREEWNSYRNKIRYVSDEAKDISFAKDIRVFGLKSWMEDLYDSTVRLLDDFATKKEKNYLWADVLDLVLDFLRNGIAYLYLIAYTLRNGLPASDFLLYFAAISGFTSWVTGILSQVTKLHNECMEISTTLEYIEYPEMFRFEGGRPIPAADSYELTLDNVTFRYPETEKNLFENLNLTIRPGEKLAIVGLNGAGKTTLVKLLCGFYDPTEGRVLLNGIDIREFNRQEYYGLLSAVYQDFSLMDTTIAENIAVQTENIDEKRVRDCLSKAGLMDFVDSLPQGLDSHVGRDVYLDGILFSGGQTQRLVLARALYKDGPILVLDEPTAALDPIAENDIYMKYNEMTTGKTSLFISHRLASTRFCDRIIFLADGKIAEEGTHSELLALDGEYAKLYEVQSRYYQEGGDFDGE